MKTFSGLQFPFWPNLSTGISPDIFEGIIVSLLHKVPNRLYCILPPSHFFRSFFITLFYQESLCLSPVRQCRFIYTAKFRYAMNRIRSSHSPCAHLMRMGSERLQCVIAALFKTTNTPGEYVISRTAKFIYLVNLLLLHGYIEFYYSSQHGYFLFKLNVCF